MSSGRNTTRLRSAVRFAAIVLIVSTMGAAQGQTFSGMRSEIRESNSRGGSAADDSPRRSRRSSASGGYYNPYCDDDDDDDFAATLVGYAFLAAASTPFVVPRAALQDDGDPAWYPDYPYDARHNGMVYDEDLPGVHNSLIVIQAEYGADFDDLNHAHGRVFGDVSQRIGFDTEFYFRHENVAAGNGNDEIWNGDVNLTYRFAQNEHWQFRAGLGVNWFADRIGSEAGLNTTYSAEWFPQDPWVLSGVIDWGRLGATSLFHYRGTFGWTHNGWGVFTGYDYLGLADEKIQAWINGVEYRF